MAVGATSRKRRRWPRAACCPAAKEQLGNAHAALHGGEQRTEDLRFQLARGNEVLEPHHVLLTLILILKAAHGRQAALARRVLQNELE